MDRRSSMLDLYLCCDSTLVDVHANALLYIILANIVIGYRRRTLHVGSRCLTSAVNDRLVCRDSTLEGINVNALLYIIFQNNMLIRV
jgi:hypothetical protein